MLTAATSTIAIAATPAKTSSPGVESRKVAPCLANTDQTRHIVDVKTPSLLSLLIQPESYDGCTIRVGGYMLYEYPGGRLFISRDDRSALGIFFGTVKLSFRGAKIPLDYDRLRTTAPRGYIVVQGRFSIAGPYRALIDEVEDYHFVLDEPSGTNE